jgi:hypothetical protein
VSEFSPRKILVPIKPLVQEPVAVQGILNWISETSYWTGSDNNAYVKKPTLQQVIEEIARYSGPWSHSEGGKLIVGFGRTLETISLKVLEYPSVAGAYWETVSKQGTFPDSNITLIITTNERFEGLGSLFGGTPEKKPMSSLYSEYSDEATWYRHSCWDKEMFSKPQVWVTGFLRQEEGKD